MKAVFLLTRSCGQARPQSSETGALKKNPKERRPGHFFFVIPCFCRGARRRTRETVKQFIDTFFEVVLLLMLLCLRLLLLNRLFQQGRQT